MALALVYVVILRKIYAVQWSDALSVVSLKAGGIFLYFTSNQLWLSPDHQNGYVSPIL
ncbi:hypothetical protein PYCCODRAFT_1463337 [Trametes coccinea BRFM310]|uniref:Uncharacterized protein n=1 Tax=Trametes coccinea (strain BRFM310) TaxID=1353009 RepID=A0A1Y2J3W0_TRAC3|nr:hypothetical protein PYCCODRAFT_1463337 [Trametes coccinea BRFM310]